MEIPVFAQIFEVKLVDGTDTSEYLCFGDAVFSQFNDGEIATADGAFDIVKADANRIRLWSSSTSSAHFFHPHHLTF